MHACMDVRCVLYGWARVSAVRVYACCVSARVALGRARHDEWEGAAAPPVGIAGSARLLPSRAAFAALPVLALLTFNHTIKVPSRT